jgi:glycosyltransferase involved in cell wall biosynthesis
MKKRILMCAESSHIASGFGNYTKEILSRLYQTNKYEIAELSCYRTPEVVKVEPWRIYPVAVSKKHPLFKDYTASVSNEFGQWRFDYALLDWQPDIVIDIRDFWNFSYQEISPLREFYHWVVAPTYDSSPAKIGTMHTFKNVDTLLFHTEWAKNDISKYNFNNLFSMGHGVVSDAVDPNVFVPLSTNKQDHKNKYGIDQDAFVVGSVMRNQRRKLIPDLFSVFAKLLKVNASKKIFLYLHTSYLEPNAWDIPSLLLENQIINHVLFTYTCNKCGHVEPKTFKGNQTTCSKCHNQSSKIWNVSSGITTEKLVDIYNLFDVYVQYASCEGFGIPVAEAASCGIPVISIDHGAMGEVCKNVGGRLIPPQRNFREVDLNADRTYPDNDMCVNIIQQYIDDPDNIKKDGANTRTKLLNSYSWDKTAKQFETLIDNIVLTGNQGKWNIPKRPSNVTLPVPEISNNRDFIYYIIDNVIQEPGLKDTSFIEEIILNMDIGLIQNNRQMVPYTRQMAVKSLEIYVSNKIALDKLRTKEINMPDSIRYFLSYK